MRSTQLSLSKRPPRKSANQPPAQVDLPFLRADGDLVLAMDAMSEGDEAAFLKHIALEPTDLDYAATIAQMPVTRETWDRQGEPKHAAVATIVHEALAKRATPKQ